MGSEDKRKGTSPKKETNFQQDLEDSLLRFKSAFELFQITESEEKKKYYLFVMNSELAIMDKIAKSVERKGIRKQEVLLSKDAKKYMENQNLENQKKLQQDIVTLAEANRRPYK